MCSTGRILVAALCVALAACGAGPGDKSSGANPGSYALTLVGAANLVLHPKEARTLQILLAQDQVGPVAGAAIHFEFQDGDPAGATVDASDVATDASGVATVHFTAGKSAGGRPSYKLVASAPGHGSDAVAFSFNVIPVRRLLEIVGSATTHVSADGASASTAIGGGNSVSLRVRELDADTGAPVAGDAILFTLPPAAVSSGGVSWPGTGPAAIVQTAPGGDATALLLTRGAASGPWLITAQPAGGGAAVTFEVTVQPASGGTPPCVCPISCGAGEHCEPGPACGTGSCVADDTTPDVTGVWRTRHNFNLREALPAALQDVFYALRVLDQALLGKLTIPGLPGWLQEIINSFVSRLLQQYLPQWLEQVIHISDDVVTMVSNLRSEGSMRLTKGVDYRHLDGAEVWTSLVFYYLPLCNGEIGGDPAAPPECARVDVYTADAESPGEVAQCKGQSLPSIAVQVAPFTAVVAGAGAPYGLEISTSRQVKLKMGKVLLVLVDQILSYLTPYHCIDEIAECQAGPGNCPLVDCYGLSQDLAGPGTWLSAFIDAGSVERLCDSGVATAGQAATQLLVDAWSPTADVLDFTGKAAIADGADPALCDSGNAHCAARLGGGSWSGDFFFKLVHELPGTWEATRPQ